MFAFYPLMLTKFIYSVRVVTDNMYSEVIFIKNVKSIHYNSTIKNKIYQL